MEKYYVLERFALMKTAVISTLDSMMLKRKGIEKNQKNNNGSHQSNPPDYADSSAE